ncbi:hypothetical protein [Flavobacterium nitrogenifigens]|uniref:Uncharacterized protein n=1 Tax=Flavobacterium nitrogenifigens TaxID=1617283 RepID=A0A521F8B7_9FLAO|nr:hypothetical protein [Flavobacterium nitrogenifigens]KAF2337817.1 hypothetical protein DM397_03825 [Flavobacterium nitrogenifigens]SMO92413.1 hypothetical protein SAMN06265220_10755 [Flavobacterium nitrogenifigens]
MKKFLLCATLSFFIFSCSQESQISESSSDPLASDPEIHFPDNALNPMDYKGKRFYEDLFLYQKNSGMPKSAAQMAEQIQFVSRSFSKSGASGKGIIPFTDEMVQAIMADPDNMLIAIVEQSALTAESKSNLIAFLESLLSKRHEEFGVLYAFVAAYEQTLISSTAIISDEKDTLLTVSSISRYSLYSEEERKDRDWDHSAGSKCINAPFEADNLALVLIIASLSSLI